MLNCFQAHLETTNSYCSWVSKTAVHKPQGKWGAGHHVKLPLSKTPNP